MGCAPDVASPRRRIGVLVVEAHMARDYLRSTWHGILDRCTNPRSRSWARYGGRGIGVSDSWREFYVFASDIRREIGDRPMGLEPNGRTPLYSLDRIDNDRGYEPGNVKWATRTEQGLNRHHGCQGYDPSTKWGQQRSRGLCGMYGCASQPSNGRTLCDRHARSRREFSTASMQRARSRRVE